MRIEEALRIAQYARKPISRSPDRNGRPVVELWLVISQRGYFGGDESGITICYADMVPRQQVSYNSVQGYVLGAEDWEPYPPRYVIDFRMRWMSRPRF